MAKFIQYQTLIFQTILSDLWCFLPPVAAGRGGRLAARASWHRSPPARRGCGTRCICWARGCSLSAQSRRGWRNSSIRARCGRSARGLAAASCGRCGLRCRASPGQVPRTSFRRGCPSGAGP